MQDVLIWIFVIGGLVLSLLALPIIVLWFWSIVMSDAPFVPVPKAAVQGIVKALNLKAGSVVYDMGCGDGRILLECIKSTPGIRAIGIEKALLPYLISRFKTRGTGIELRREDFFQTDLSDATHVVLYLFPELMKKIEHELLGELRSGSVVLAIDFSFPDRTPTAVTELADPRLKRGKRLSLYTF